MMIKVKHIYTKYKLNIEQQYGDDENHIRIASREGCEWNTTKENPSPESKAKIKKNGKSSQKHLSHKLLTISQTNYQYIQNQRISQMHMMKSQK